jgi:hypothetical protein
VHVCDVGLALLGERFAPDVHQCWDYALAESFFASIKGELLDLQPGPT